MEKDGSTPTAAANDALDGAVLNIVDGGYGENSGTAQIAELWTQLEPLIEAYNEHHPARQIIPVLVEIQNGERGGADTVSQPITSAGELLRPILAILGARSGRDADVAELLFVSIDRCNSRTEQCPIHLNLEMFQHPGRTMPLGWTLSSNSVADLSKQLGVGPNKEALAEFETLFPLQS